MDIDKLKEMTEYSDASGVIYWGEREDPDSRLVWNAEGERTIDEETRAAQIRFKYTLTNPRTDESERVEYAVTIDYTECNFGGVRPWFICPGCGDRRRKIYLPPRGGDGRYLCRECYGLGYRSSRTSGDELKQAELRYRRAFAKADAEDRRPHPNNTPHSPERPKGMHHDTFEELCEEVRAAEAEWNARQIEEMKQIIHNYTDTDMEGWI